MGDLSTVDGRKAELVRAFEHGDAGQAASLYEPGARLVDGTWRWATDMWNSDAG